VIVGKVRMGHDSELDCPMGQVLASVETVFDGCEGKRSVTLKMQVIDYQECTDGTYVKNAVI
jgi:hypothetical protein